MDFGAHHVKKLALSNAFDEIKSFVEKIGTNRRLLAKKVGWDFVRPFDLIPKYTENWGRSLAPAGQNEYPIPYKFPERLSWSGWRDLNSRPPRRSSGRAPSSSRAGEI